MLVCRQRGPGGACTGGKLALGQAGIAGGVILDCAVGDVLRAIDVGRDWAVSSRRVGATVWRSARRTAMRRRILACERLKSAARPRSEVEVTAPTWPAVPQGGGPFQTDWARPLR